MQSKYTINYWLNSFLDLIFPQKCLGCGKAKIILCENCVSNLNKATFLDKNLLNKDFYAFFDYRDPLVRKIIWALKYHHHRNLGNIIGKIMYKNLDQDIKNIIKNKTEKKILVIPVPISRKKLIFRGYNQSQIIASSFCKHSEKENFELKNNIIYKKRETKPQAKIKNKRERLLNIVGVFKIKNSHLIKNKTVIVIDDVITTGGTFGEIRKILKKNGAKNIFCLAFAH